MAETKTLKSDPLLLDMRAASEFIGLTYWKFYALVKSKTIPVVEINNKFYFRRSTLVRFVERSEGRYKAA
jgi:hypothetical protein